MTFVPSDIAGLDLWLVADDIAGNDGDMIASWVSKEGNSYDFAQATDAKKPLLKKAANGINGHNTALFEGTDDLLICAGANLLNDSTGTFFVVARLSSSPSNGQSIFASSDEASTNYNVRFYGYISPSDPSTAIIQVNDDGWGDDCRGYFTVDTNPFISVNQSTGTLYLRRKNALYDTNRMQTGSNTGDWFADTPNRDNLTIGAMKSSSETEFLKGHIAEIIYYDTSLSLANVELVENYLAAKYGITLPTAVTFLNIPISCADVDTAGNIYAGQGAIIKKSTDGGDTWTDIYTVLGSPLKIDRVFIDSRGYIFVSGNGGTSDWGLYYSKNNGASFTSSKALDENCCIWGMDEDTNGNLYIGEYSWGGAAYGQAQIWKSTDGGDTWVQKYTDPTAGVDHIHDVRVDLTNNYIYASRGDNTLQLLRSKDLGATWTNIYSTTKLIAFAFASGYVYAGSDADSGDQKIYRFIDDGSDAPSVEVAYDLPVDHNAFVFAACEYGTKVAMLTAQTGTYRDIWLWDGATWSAIHTDISPHTFEYCSRHNKNGKFYVGNGASRNGVRLTIGATGGGVRSILAYGHATLTETQPFIETGCDAILAYGQPNKYLFTSAGAFVETGNNAILARKYATLAAAGSFSLSGQNAILIHSYKVLAAAGAFNLSGNNAYLLRFARLLSAAGSFTESGQNTLLLKAFKTLGATRSFILIGNNAILIYNPVAGAYYLFAATGNFSLSGQDTILLLSRKILAESGAYSLTGSLVLFLIAYRLLANKGLFTLTGYNAILIQRAAVIIGMAVAADTDRAGAAATNTIRMDATAKDEKNG